MRHQADDVAASLQMPAMLLTEPFGLAVVGLLARACDVAEDDLAIPFEPIDDVGSRSSCLRRARLASSASDRVEARVNGVSVCSTLTCTYSQRNCRLRFRSIAPGSRPASSSTWKPLQMPSTGPPAAANGVTSCMIGENRAIAPVRR